MQPKSKSPAALARGEAEDIQIRKTANDSKRTARRQHLSRHLHAAGPRPCMEALLEVADGCDLDAVLESYGRISVETYHELEADTLPMDRLRIIDGGVK